MNECEAYQQGVTDTVAALALAESDPIRDEFARMQGELDDHERDVLLHDVGAMEVGAQSEAAAYDADDPMGWLVRWLPEQLAAIESKREAYKAWLERENKRLDRQAAYLIYRWGREAEIEVANQTRGGKTKSIDTPYGRIGFRSRKPAQKIVIDDEEQAIAHAAEVCPDAIRTTRKLLVSKLKDRAEPLRGTRIEITPGGESFFVGKRTLYQPALPAPEPPKRITAAEFCGKENTDAN